jgi:putative phosphoesterase
MKIYVISDTHIPERARTIPGKLLDDLKNADLILHAGDIADSKVLEILRGVCKEVKAVWGNMDPPELRKSIPEREIISIEGLRLGIAHGYGNPLKLIDTVSNIFKGERLDIIVFGHSHFPVNETRAGVLYFNPGSPTDKIFSVVNSYGILELKDKQIKAEIIRI